MADQRDVTVTLTGVEAVGLAGTVNARVKTSLSRIHLGGASFFAERAAALEPIDPLRDADANKDQHRAYVIGAILSAVAAMEASINELYHEVASSEVPAAALSDEAIKKFTADVGDPERVPVLGKYQRALRHADAPTFDEGVSPFQDIDSLVKLRDALVHYKPEWHDAPKGKHPKLKTRLRNKFAPNPAPPGFIQWFPHLCLSAGCAEWAIRTVTIFVKDFTSRLGIAERF